MLHLTNIAETLAFVAQTHISSLLPCSRRDLNNAYRRIGGDIDDQMVLCRGLLDQSSPVNMTYKWSNITIPSLVTNL